LSEKEFKELSHAGVTIGDLFHSAKIFSPYNRFAPVTSISIYFAIDILGNFITNKSTPAHKIAFFLWNKLPAKEKLRIAKYIDTIETIDKRKNEGKK